MKKILFLIVCSWVSVVFSQSTVGINTTNPSAALDVEAKTPANPLNTDGFIVPRIDAFPSTPPTSAQNSMIVYLTTTDGSNTPGFYYWDNSATKWASFGGTTVDKIDDLIDGKSINPTSANPSLYLGIGAGASDDSDNKRNVGIGYKALNKNKGTGTSAATGNDNLAIGYKAMMNNKDGDDNVAIGSLALTSMINDGDDNVAIGFKALTNANATSSDFNVAVGSKALFSSTSGRRNTVVGTRALFTNSTGDENTAFGYEAGYNNTGSRNIFIGYQAGYNETGDDKLYIANSNTTQPLIYGDFSDKKIGINWDTSVALPQQLSVNGNASKGTAGAWLGNSDRRLKKNIVTISPEEALEKITKLRGVTYEWNDNVTGYDRPKGVQYGFIAQELMKVFPSKVSKDPLGYYQTAYGDYDAFFVQAIKALKQKIERLEKKRKKLETKLANYDLKSLEARLSALEKKQ